MLGFIIFGWPTKDKHIGAASPGYCDHCQNQVTWHLVKTRRWASLFFIPLLPLGRADWWLMCDICSAAVKLEADEAPMAKQMVRKTEHYAVGELDADGYSRAVSEFTELVEENGDPEATHVESEWESEDTVSADA